MDVIHSAADLRARLQRVPNNVFVPTMGNLHDGHIQLINIAKPRAACTVVSIFVNRLQFGPREDFDRYPRTLDADAARLKAAGVDVLFVPDEKEIYPERQTFVVEPSDLQYILEGAHRPGHFRGVATVVLKLFNLVMPHSAIFGKKDYQQYLVLRDMVRQFALPIEIIPAETVRAPDGLALSSRNAYLTPESRKVAANLNRVLADVGERARAGVPVPQAEAEGAAALISAGFDRVDYVAIRDAETLVPLRAIERPARALAAARIGSIRLIDNRPV
jgi:pantoate--beta-alanine ligase